MDKKLIMDLISDNKTEEALRILKEQLEAHDYQVEVILLSRRLESLNQKIRLGVIDDRDRNKEENQINYSIVSLLGKIEIVEYDFSNSNNDLAVDESIKTNTKEKQNSNNFEKSEKSKTIFWVIPILLLASFVFYYFFLKPAPPIDCDSSLTFRNNVSYIETNTEFFNNVRYNDINGFAISFEKGKSDTANNIWIDTYISFEKRPNDSMEIRAEYYKYAPANLHFTFKGGGETYILTTYDRFYSLREGHHIHFKSDTLLSEIVEKIKNNKVERVSLFNEAFSLTPYPNFTMPFEDDPNEIAIEKLSQHMRCLTEYGLKK